MHKQNRKKGLVKVLLTKNQIEMPNVPKAFIHHPKVRQVLCHTIEEFNFEEQMAIYLYGVLDLPINEIAISTELSQDRIICVLMLYAERLAYKVDVFKKAVPYNSDEIASVCEVFVLEV